MGEGVLAALAGVAGGLRGGVDNYQWQRERNDRQESLAEANRIRDDEVKRKGEKDKLDEQERQRQVAAQREIIDALPDTNPDGSPNQMKIGLRVSYGFAGKGTLGTAIVTEAGKDARYDRPSGNVVANNTGAMDRLKKNIDFGYDKTFLEENGRNARWAAPSGNATLGSETTRRGQDVGATTARRGQDIGASTARRGQDLTFDLGTTRDATDRRGQDRAFTLGIAKKKGSILDAFNVPGPSDVHGDDVNLPVEPTVPAAPVSPIATVPRPNTPAPARPGGGDLSALTTKAEATLRAYRAEQDPAKKRALAAEMADLKRQRDALVAGGGR